MTDKSLGKVKLPESMYKADLELHDRYQLFSSELLKLSLAGIAVIGFLLRYLQDEQPANLAKQVPIHFHWIMVIAGVLLCISVGGALMHKFTASKGFYYHLKALRLQIGYPEDFDDIALAERRRNSLYRLSGKGFLTSTLALFLGVSFLAISFIVYLSSR